MQPDRPVFVEEVEAQDVEITAEMLAAGLSAYEWFSKSVDPGYLVEQVYIAMVAARPQAPPGPSGC